MTKEELVISVLKTKVASLGFSKDEIKSAAAVIASNLDISEDAIETEEATSKAESAVGAIIPLLKLSQSQANRAIENFKKSQQQKPEDNPEGNGKNGEGEGNQNGNQGGNSNDTAPVWANKMYDTMLALQHELNQMKSTKTTETRKSRLEAMLKDSGSFGKTMIRNFERMNFADEAAFDAYLEEVKTDLDAYNKERGDAALSTLGGKPNPNSALDGKLTDADIKKIVEAM